VDQYIEQLS